MLKFLADENLNGDIVRGLLRQKNNLDVVRVQEVGLSGADDPAVLDFAALENRILLTHDVNTITKYAYERIAAGDRMPGVFEISRAVSVSSAIKDILLLAECSFENEWEGQVRYLPLR